jgi:hypothetical protein
MKKKIIEKFQYRKMDFELTSNGPYMNFLKMVIMAACDIIFLNLELNKNIDEIINILEKESPTLKNDMASLLIKRIITEQYPDKTYLITAHDINLL